MKYSHISTESLPFSFVSVFIRGVFSDASQIEAAV